MSTPHDLRVNNEQKDGPSIPLGMSKAKYVILQWVALILLLVVASAFWWWPRYVEGHFSKTQKPSSVQSEVKPHIPSSAEPVVNSKEQSMSVRLADLEEKLQTLEEKLKKATLEGVLGHSLMNPEMGEGLKHAAEQKVTALKTLFKIERAIQYGRPFELLFESLKSKASGLESVSSSLSVLESVAEGGAPTLRHLQEQFEENKMMTKTALFETFRLNQIVDSFLSLIHIEKINDDMKSEHNETPQLSTLMEKGDVAAVVESIEALGSTERQAYDAWLMQAKLYLDVQEAFDAVLAEVIGEKRAEGTPKTPNDDHEIQVGVRQ